jgi:hypothetical protein
MGKGTGEFKGLELDQFLSAPRLTFFLSVSSVVTGLRAYWASAAPTATEGCHYENG